MNNFKVIYQILKYLEEAMDFSEPDYEPIKSEALGLTEERWEAIIMMLLKDGYIEGVIVKDYIRQKKYISEFEPKITLKGLEYLNENGMMKKIVKAAKGIKDTIPGL